MGRRPNPVIATNFIRGDKHGQTTNRYAQTCRHCNTLFPTGRPETLFAHLATCPDLTPTQRADIVHQMYNTSSSSQSSRLGTVTNQQLGSTSHSSHIDDFDITGLNVLAGAAENAEDLAIDPQITEPESVLHSSTSAAQPMTFYDTHYENPFQSSTASHTNWSFPFHDSHDSASPYAEGENIATTGPNFSPVTLPTTQWTFESVMTPPGIHVAHSTNPAQISFAEQDSEPFAAGDGESSALQMFTSGSAKARKNREPYNEPKRARIAEMRQVGACIRCSRLRKPCEAARPCKICRQTASKTWLGGCTSLNKGQEFNFWFDTHLSDAYAMRSAADTTIYTARSDFEGHLELAYFGEHGPKLRFALVQADKYSYQERGDNVADENVTGFFLIHTAEDVAQKLLTYAAENQERLIEDVESPALYNTVRVAQGLAVQQDEKDDNLVWGSCKQADSKLASIMSLWLIVNLLTVKELDSAISFITADGKELDNEVILPSSRIVASKIETVLETSVQQCKDQFRRFDADILNQSYKHLFNLVVGMVLILDMVEKYCCFIKRRNLPGADLDLMFEQARTLAYKYTYCVHNIQMMPPVTFDAKGVLVGEKTGERVDHQMQRIWLADLCMTEDDLNLYFMGDMDNQWLEPSGRLWAGLFKGLPIE